MRTTHGRIIELQHQLELLLGACVDYHNALARAGVPDAVTPRAEIQNIYNRFEIRLEPRSLYGEAPHGRVYDSDRRA